MKTQPDFICPGMQKAGTTWLFRNLAEHPNVWLPPIKEIHYFDEYHNDPQWWQRRVAACENRLAAEENKLAERKKNGKLPEKNQFKRIRFWKHVGIKEINDRWYQGIWELTPEGNVTGDITPDYSVLKNDGVEHVQRLCPNAKIIFLLRDPIERTWSAARMWANECGKDLRECYKAGFILARSDYMHCLQIWEQFYPKDQIFIAFYEDVATNPTTVLQQVCQIIDIPYSDTFFPHLAEPVHVGKQAEMPEEVYAFYKEHFRENIAFLAEHAGGYAQEWWIRHYS